MPLTPQQLRDVLLEVNEFILDRMQELGWFYGDSRERRFDRPVEWDINCGWCEEWALEAQKRIGVEAADVDLDAEMGTPEDEYPVYAHTVLYYGGLYYDSEHIQGVSKEEMCVRISRESFLEINGMK